MFPPVFENGFRENGFPVNSPLDVARVILGVVAGTYRSARYGNGKAGTGEIIDGEPRGDGENETGHDKEVPEEAETEPNKKEQSKGPNGMTLYVEGGRAWDIEPGLAATQEIWMGKEQSVTLRKAGEWLAMVCLPYPFPSIPFLSYSCNFRWFSLT